MNVSRNSFVPAPNVDSVVISLKRKENKVKAINEELFNKLVRDSFKYKRKSIKNNLKGYDLNTIEEVLSKYHKTLLDRAETLPYEVFVEISNNLE